MLRIPVLHSEDGNGKTSVAANLARRYVNGSLVTTMAGYELPGSNRLGLSARATEHHEIYSVPVYSPSREEVPRHGFATY